MTPPADQISIEAAQLKLDLGVLKDLSSKKIMLGVLDLADPAIESVKCRSLTAFATVSRYVSPERLVPAPDAA